MERQQRWRQSQRRQRSQLRDETRLLRAFLCLMKGATAEDWLWIYHFDDVRARVFVFDEENELSIPSNRAVFQVPWPMLLMCGRYHQKHIFMPNKYPSTRTLQKDLENFRHRIGWKWFFRSEISSPPSIYIKAKHSVTPCFEKLPDELNSWIDGLREQIISKVSEMRTPGRSSWQGNCLPVIKYALKLFYRYQIMAVKNDKDPGFTLMTFDQYDHAFQGIAEMKTGDMKIYLKWNGLQAPIESLRKQYIQLAGKIENFEDEEGLKRAICRSLSISGSSRLATLDITCKSHKPTVSFRPLHTAAGYAFKGLSMWLCKKVRAYFSDYQYLLSNSSSLTKDLRKLVAEPTFVIAKFDIKDFFLSGTPEQLIRDAKVPFSGMERELIGDVVEFSLTIPSHHQP